MCCTPLVASIRSFVIFETLLQYMSLTVWYHPRHILFCCSFARYTRSVTSFFMFAIFCVEKPSNRTVLSQKVYTNILISRPRLLQVICVSSSPVFPSGSRLLMPLFRTTTNMYVYLLIYIVITYSKFWINRVRLPILLVFS